MDFQSDLEGTRPEPPDLGLCVPSCYNALKPKCVCRCGGTFHSLGRNGEHNKEQDPELTPKQARKFKRQIIDDKCGFCGHNLTREPIRHYPHKSGWKVAGIRALQWLYIVCPNCGYQWALWKLGVKR